MSSDSAIDFQSIHEAYYENLKKNNPDNEYCIMCFDTRSIINDLKLCVDCMYITGMLEKIKKSAEKSDIKEE